MGCIDAVSKKFNHMLVFLRQLQLMSSDDEKCRFEHTLYHKVCKKHWYDGGVIGSVCLITEDRPDDKYQ